MPDPFADQVAMAGALREGASALPAPGAAREGLNIRRAVAKQENRNPSVWENMAHRLIGVNDPVGFQRGQRRNPNPSIFDLQPEDLKDL